MTEEYHHFHSLSTPETDNTFTGRISFIQGWLNWDCVLLVVSLPPLHEVILPVEGRNEMGTKREVEPRRELRDG